MALIQLVRHAQASFGSEHYDRLSDLGRQQSRWLGEYFAARGLSFCRIVTGTLERQRDTALEVLTAMGVAAEGLIEHPGLDEYHGERLYAAHTGGRDPRDHQRSDYRDYWRTFRSAMTAWSEDRLAGLPETWGQFGERMADALRTAGEGCGRDDCVLVVSSGGAIGRYLAALLGSPASVAIELNLQYRNTGICELRSAGDTFRVISFNNVPHLEDPARRHAITFA
ncbi:MAG TPA: histidine phosphatase family protein [Burkholderiaceae bacterium]|nr:histidine phosphatase family protein [Burkholderiaceae bacterium]